MIDPQGDSSKEELAEAARTANPEEINIEEEDENESEDEVDGKYSLSMENESGWFLRVFK